MFRNLKVEEALEYLDRVKLALSEKPDMYSTFLDVMNDFKSQKIGTADVVCRIKDLFKYFPELLVGFNAFMPMDNKIEPIQCSNGQDFFTLKADFLSDSTNSLNEENVTEIVDTSEKTEQNSIYDSCVSFLTRVEKSFPDDSTVFSNFLRIIYRCLMELGGESTEAMETDKIYSMLKRMFGADSNLLRETMEIFPKMVQSSKFLMKYIELAIDVSQLISCDWSFNEASTSSSEYSMELCASMTHRKRPRDVSPSTNLFQKLRRVDKNFVNTGKDSNETVLNGSYEEYLFFDKVRKALNDEEVYRNFLRCLFLYNQNLITKTELMQLLTPFLGKFPKIVRWLRKFLNCDELVGYVEFLNPNDFESSKRSYELNLEIDYASCKRLGVSYRELPKNFVIPKCSGRTPLCNEVLNNSCVSFPSWQSEDSSVVSSKKTQHEECIYRTEDERFELEIVIEVNKAAIQAFETILKRMNRMNVNDAKRFQLDSFLGGRSQVIQQRAIKRVYGDKSSDIVDGLTRNPFVAVPLVLNRLKAKDKEWKEAQRRFNELWREQNEKSYWKSLDQQGNAFKQNDLKLIRSKTLINQIEILFDERCQAMKQNLFCNFNDGPLMQLVYPRDRKVFADANDILLHSIQRQTNFQKNENDKIKNFLKEFFPSLLGAECEQLSDNDEQKLSGYVGNGTKKKPGKMRSSAKCLRSSTSAGQSSVDPSSASVANGKADRPFGRTLMYLPESWYIFVRLQYIFVERLARLKSLADDLARSEKFNLENLSSTHDTNKNCRKNVTHGMKDFYSTLIKQIKNLLDGEIDNTQYEDILKDFFASDCYLAFTFDKIVQNCVKQLHAIVNDEISIKAQNLFQSSTSAQYFFSHQRSPNAADIQLVTEAKKLFEGQNCFKTVFYDDGRVTFGLLPPSTSDEFKSKTVADDFNASHRWSEFVESHLDGENISLSLDDDAKPVYLQRNVRKFRKQRKKGEFSKDKGNNSSSNDGDNLIIYEDLQALLTNRRQRSLYYVAGTLDFMYRKKISSNSGKTFLRSVDMRNRRFCDWHERWLISNVTLNEARSVADWLVEGKLDEVSLNNSLKIQRTTESCPRRPPFCMVNRYLSSIRKMPTKFLVETT